MTSPAPFSASRRRGASNAQSRAFSDLYRDYFPRVFAYVYGRVHNPHLAEDIVADVFERAYTNLGSLRRGGAFTTWLFTIARNAIISHGRKYGRESVVDHEVLHQIAPSGVSVEGEVLMREEQGEIALLVRQLPQREQDIIALKFDAELANSQIAEIMELGEPNVRVILFRTLRKLRQMLAEQETGSRSRRRDPADAPNGAAGGRTPLPRY